MREMNMRDVMEIALSFIYFFSLEEIRKALINITPDNCANVY